MAAPLVKEDVERAVVIVIEQRYSPCHGLKRVSLRADAIFECERDPGGLDAVLKLDREAADRTWCADRLPRSA